MVATTLRFSEVMHELVTKEAEEDQVSVSQFCREAAIARVFFQAGRRGEIREMDRVNVMRAAFEELGVDADHGIEVVCSLFKSLPGVDGHDPDDDPDEEHVAA